MVHIPVFIQGNYVVDLVLQENRKFIGVEFKPMFLQNHTSDDMFVVQQSLTNIYKDQFIGDQSINYELSA